MSSLANFRSHPAWDAAVWVLLTVAVMVLRQLAHRSRLTHRLDASLSLIAFGILVGGIAVLVRLSGFAAATPYFDAVILGALALGGVRAALTVFVDFYLRQRRGAAVSAIVRDIASIVAYFIVVVVVLRTTLDFNLASVVATSAVLTAIVGLALQDTLSNLFSGLVLEVEAPFSSGDWVKLGEFEGTIEETGWRTTKLRTRVNEIVTLPNAVLSRQAIVNYSRPSPLYGDTLHFEMAYEAPPNDVKRAIFAVLAAEPMVQASPASEVRVEKFGESGVRYGVRYWITEYGELDRIRSRINTNLWYALRRAKLRIPYPARDLFFYPGNEPTLAAESVDMVGRLRSVPLLAPLDDASLGRLAAGIRRLTFGTGEIVVRQGEAGDSFYVIDSGDAEVTMANGARSTVVGTLAPGSFFGEMSLLAGEPRTATVRALSDLVVMVIGREVFQEIISRDPALLGPISDIAARRHAAQEEQRHVSEPAVVESEGQRVQKLRERIWAFFAPERTTTPNH